MENDNAPNSLTTPPRRWLRFSLRNLLAAFAVIGLCLAWWTGRITIQGERPTCVADFGDLTILEWELPQSAKSFFLQVDGKRIVEVEKYGGDHKLLRLAIVEDRDATAYHVQLGGVGMTTKVPTLHGVTRRQTWSRRQIRLGGSTPLYLREDLDADYQTVRKVELVIE